MPVRNESGSKARLLFLERYLLEHTDDHHFLTTEDILALCREHGFKSQRATVGDDMGLLSAAGLDVIQERVAENRTAMNAYHIGSRLFELAELRMLVDAVSSSRFITVEKSDQLVSKLAMLTNEQNRSSLTGKVYNADRMKTSNLSVFVIMDLIRTAIDAGRKLSFHYWDYTIRKEKVLRHGGELYVASPYALIWDDDRYYMAAWSDKRQKIVKYRVDRMCDVNMLEEPAVADDSFNPAVYSRSVIRMFDDDLPETQVTLLCENRLMQNVLDRFGEETETEVAGIKSFRARVKVVPSSTFLSWVFQYQGDILIESPAEVRTQYEQMLKGILNRQEVLDVEHKRKEEKPGEAEEKKDR